MLHLRMEDFIACYCKNKLIDFEIFQAKSTADAVIIREDYS